MVESARSRNLVVAASAGTGKTYALVGVLLRLLLGAGALGVRAKGRDERDAIDPSRVVATTFSRKAAAEIRARLVTELERLAGGAESAYAAALARDDVASRWSSADLSRRARRALDGVSRAFIGTLHGFAGTLVREHAMELGLSPGFEIEPEDERVARTDRAIARALTERLRENGIEARALADAAGGVDTLVAVVSQCLAKLEEDGRGAESLTIDDSDAHTIALETERVVELARALEKIPRFAEPAAMVGSAWRAKDEDALAVAMERLFDVRAAAKKSDDEVALFALRAAAPGLRNADKGRVFAHRFANRNRFDVSAREMRALIIAAERIRNEETLHTSTLGFGDLVRVARDLLRDRVDVARAASASLDALLVDELQDTSRLQRDLLLSLWADDTKAERVAGRVPHISEQRESGLFLVGDRKQSIYGFRGADVGVFAELCIGLAGEPARRALGVFEGTTWEPARPIADFEALVHNRRGEPELLEFANVFSARRFSPESTPPAIYEIAYVAETEDLRPPPDRAEKLLDRARTTWLRVPGERGASTRLEEAWVIVDSIREILEKKEPLRSGNAPTYRDCAVLARTNEMLDAAAFALSAAGIPYALAGRGFFAAREVHDVAALLAVLVDPGDKLAMLSVLRGPCGGVSDRTLVGLTEPSRGLQSIAAWGKGSRASLLLPEDRASLDRVRETVTRIHGAIHRLGPGTALREAVRELDLEETLVLMPRGAARVANVRKLIARVDRETDAPRALDRLRDALDRESPESEAATFSDDDDAVRLLTVHASKGLDFPIVLIPEVGAPPRPRPAPVARIGDRDDGRGMVLSVRVTDRSGEICESPSYARVRTTEARRERAERQRLWYVAITRASSQMIFVGDRKKGGVAYGDTTVAVLDEIAESPSRDAAWLSVKEASVSLPAPPGDLASPNEERAPEESMNAALSPKWQSIAVAPTALQDFASCARRFELAHLVALPEHPFRGGSADATGKMLDAREEGTLMHHVLETIDASSFGAEDASVAINSALEKESIGKDHPRQAAIGARLLRFLGGAYAKEIAESGATVIRERAFFLEITAEKQRALFLEMADEKQRALVMRGSIDLLVRWPKGTVDVIDYKRARGPSAEPYAFQLDVYALAARSIFPEASAIRTGVVFLGGTSAEPMWHPHSEANATRAKLLGLAPALVDARWKNFFPRAPVTTCHAIHCGYVGRCHPAEGSETTANADLDTTT